MKAFVYGSFDKITVEAVCFIDEWKNKNHNHFVLSKDDYLKLESHFINEYTSIVKFYDKVFVS